MTLLLEDVVAPPAAARRVVLAEETDAEHRSHHDMRGRDRQAELRSEEHGASGR